MPSAVVPNAHSVSSGEEPSQSPDDVSALSEILKILWLLALVIQTLSVILS